MRKRILASPTAAALLAGVSLVAAACGDDAPPPSAKAAAPAARAAAQKAEAAKAETAAAPAEGATLVEYVYSPVGKRDPFRSVIEDQKPAEVPLVEANCGPLCSWELDQLRLVAVVSGMASPLAMVDDPQGNGHVIRRGMSIGKRSGKVTDIRRDHLVVTELQVDPKGQVIPAKTEMLLRAKGAEKDSMAVDLTPQDSQ